MKREEITLEIDVFTPDTLPMARLAQYLAEFSELLGHEANVHFSRLTKGSAKCKAFVDTHVAPKIRERVESIVDGSAPKTAIKAQTAIDDLLAADNAIGGVYLGEEKVIEFPGRRRAAKEKIGPVRRSTTIEGQIFSIGGKDETINVHLRGKREQMYRCEVSVELARRLAPYFLNGNVRLFGEGEWYRVDSKWEMYNFTATDFVGLERKGLPESIDSIREIFDGDSAAEFINTMRDLRHE
jgi:hypothetical protein